VCVASAGATLARDVRLPGDRAEVRDRTVTLAMHLIRQLLQEAAPTAS
jgi:nicotinamide-nucleotide amidase